LLDAIIAEKVDTVQGEIEEENVRKEAAYTCFSNELQSGIDPDSASRACKLSDAFEFEQAELLLDSAWQAYPEYIEWLHSDNQQSQESSCEVSWNIFDSENCINQAVTSAMDTAQDFAMGGLGFAYELGNNYLWDVPHAIFGETIDSFGNPSFNAGRGAGYLFNLAQSAIVADFGKSIQNFGGQAKGWMGVGGASVGAVIGGVTAGAGCLFGATVITGLSGGVGAVSYTCVVPAWVAGSASGAAAGAGIGYGLGLGIEVGGGLTNIIGQANNANLTSRGGPSGGGTGSTSRSANQLNQDIRKGSAPDGIERADTPRIPYEKPHVHFNDGRALNNDGTWKHNPNNNNRLTKKQREWLEANGWLLP